MRRPTLARLTLSITAGILAAGCGPRDPGPRPDMSASRHRQAAAEHERRAADHDERYDPDGTRLVGVGVRNPGAPEDPGFYPVQAYNPTGHHAEEARIERAHAEQHLARARMLEVFEDESCTPVPAEVRGACPLHVHGVVAEPTERGIRLRVPDGVDARAAADHVRCHLASARTRGHEGMDGCPLYLPGLRIEITDGGRTIDVIAPSRKLRAAVHARLKTHGDACHGHAP
jgi:hypothetical protein